MEEQTTSSVLPLTPASFHIALALAEGERHGYGIMQDIERLTGGKVQMGSGTLYRSIQKMQIDGLIEERTEAGASQEQKRFFKLTRFGVAVAREEARRLEELVAVAKERKFLSARNKRRKKT